MGKDGETDITQTNPSADHLTNTTSANSVTTMDAPSQSTTTNTTPTTDTDNTNVTEAALNAINSSTSKALGNNNDLSTAEARLKELERLFLGGPTGGFGPCYSMETLLDVLLVLHDECINSSMRREKTVSDFIEYGEYLLEIFLTD